jgi:hypothetical protein
LHQQSSERSTTSSAFCSKREDQLITGRELRGYRPTTRLTFSKPLQLIEIGAGFGALIPHAIETNPQLPQPIVVDPVDYHALLDILKHTLARQLYQIPSILHVTIARYAKRLEFYLSGKIRHVN